MTLTTSQLAVLTAACGAPDGRLTALPETLKLPGGARAKVLGALVQRGLLKATKDAHVITAAGRRALGETAPRAMREGTKQATVIALLQRRSGATIAQLCEATGWQAHTVRGTLSGALKKRLGMTLTSEKTTGARVYRLG